MYIDKIKHIPLWVRIGAVISMFLAVGKIIPPVEFRQLYANRAFRILDRNGVVLRVVGRERGLYVPLAKISLLIRVSLPSPVTSSCHARPFTLCAAVVSLNAVVQVSTFITSSMLEAAPSSAFKTESSLTVVVDASSTTFSCVIHVTSEVSAPEAFTLIDFV